MFLLVPGADMWLIRERTGFGDREVRADFENICKHCSDDPDFFSVGMPEHLNSTSVPELFSFHKSRQARPGAARVLFGANGTPRTIAVHNVDPSYVYDPNNNMHDFWKLKR